MAGGSERSPRVKVGLVGGGRGGAALLELILEWPDAELAVVIDPRPEAPAVAKAQALGIPVSHHHRDVFLHPVNIVFEATGQLAVLEDLLRSKPAGVEVIGAGGLRLFWDLFQHRARAARQLKAQVEMAVALGSALDLREQLLILTRKLAEACDVHRCVIFVWDEETGLVTPLMAQFATGETNPRMWRAFKELGRLPLADLPFLSDVMERRAALEITDPASSPLIPEGWTDLFDSKSLLVVPMVREGRAAGACVLDSGRDAYRFSPDQTALAITLTGQLALALDNARLYQRAEARAEKLTALSRLTKLLTLAPKSAEVFHAVAKAATTLLGAAAARVWVDDPVMGVLREQASFGTDPQLERLMTDFPVLPYGEGLVGRIFESRRPEYLADIGQDPLWLNRRLATEGGLRGFAGVPLITGDRVVGVLAILFSERRVFTPEETELMGLLADQAAIAIHNARLYEETEHRRREAESLAVLGRVISQSLDPDEVAQRIADSVRTLFDARVAGLYRIDPESEDLVPVAISGEVGPTFRQLVFPRGVSTVGWAVRERRPVATADVLSDPHITLTLGVRAGIERAGFRAALGVPLLAKEQIIGVLAVGDHLGRRFDEEHIRLAQAFGDQAALALENARLYQKAQHAYQELGATQAQLVRGETLRATGELAAGAAHHLNNLLAVVCGRLELALSQFDAPEIRAQLTPALRAARDGAHVVRRLTSFSRTDAAPTLVPVDLNDLAEEAVGFTRPRWQDVAEARGVRIEVDLERGLIPRVAAAPPAMREVFVNLILNAVDALPRGGRIMIKTWVADHRVHCAVSDTGTGMAAEIQRRVLEPFFTTKGLQSTGLGLSVTYGIIQRHGGDLRIESTEGQGATVTFYLPEVARQEEAAPAPKEPTVTRALRILVIDDETDVRRVIADMLAAEGHQVVEAANGPDGLTRLAEGPPLDLVLTDLGMPGMTGWDVARAIKASHPRVCVGLHTGWGEPLHARPDDRGVVDFILPKPATREGLRAAIARTRPSHASS
jgi:GAF domain-containing protein/CheY-like chemotaxis protein